MCEHLSSQQLHGGFGSQEPKTTTYKEILVIVSKLACRAEKRSSHACRKHDSISECHNNHIC